LDWIGNNTVVPYPMLSDRHLAIQGLIRNGSETTDSLNLEWVQCKTTDCISCCPHFVLLFFFPATEQRLIDPIIVKADDLRHISVTQEA